MNKGFNLSTDFDGISKRPIDPPDSTYAKPGIKKTQKGAPVGNNVPQQQKAVGRNVAMQKIHGNGPR